jgi:hypothetical protein
MAAGPSLLGPPPTGPPPEMEIPEQARLLKMINILVKNDVPVILIRRAG